MIGIRFLARRLLGGLVVLTLGLNLWPETSTMKRVSGLIIKGTPKDVSESSD